MQSTSPPSSSPLAAAVLRHTAAVLDLDASAIDPAHSFAALGVDSLRAVRLTQALAAELDRALSPTLLWECPTIEALARRLAGEDARPTPAATAGPVADEPLAIIGLACRLPGGGDGPARFWELLCAQVDGVVEIPPDRWDLARWYDPDPAAPGKFSVREAGFLPAVDRFDAAFFEISPREAAQIDPQQRLALELAWEALEDAGVPPRSLAHRRVGVYMGAVWRDYGELAASAPEGLSLHSGPGQALDVIANRISFALGLMGPSLTVDTACSSSLAAIHLAAQAIRAGECELALAGGVSLMLAPTTAVALCKLGALAPDGRSKSFSASADGYGRGEGGGMIVLKPLSAALRDNDPIFAVLRGSAMNNDGPSNGLTAPNPRAQEDVLADAWARAGVDPAQAAYIEAHGTGTPLGDPIEARALGQVFTRQRPPGGPPLLVGSVKSNLGHLEAAAGIAGCIKTVLALHHRQVPANLHFTAPSPYIPFAELGLAVPTARQPWRGAPAAGVSSFGWGGTNCHVVLQAAPGPGEALALLAAPDAATLSTRLHELAARVEAEPDAAPRLCAAAVGDEGPARVGVTLALHDAGALAQQLRAAAPTVQAATGARPRVIWVMSPQGGQWPGMGLSLLRDPVAGAVLRRCDAVLRELAGWSLIEALCQPAPLSRSAAVVQPLLVCQQMAMAERLRRWGVEPDEIVGHSLGEISAAWAAGALDLEDAVRTIFHYSRLQATTAGNGGMAVVELAADEVAALLGELGDRRQLAGQVVIAGRNGIASTILSGEPQALDQVVAEVHRRGCFGARVDVDVAAHSPQIDPIMAELRAALADLRPRPATRPLWSSARQQPLVGDECDGDYWARNLRDAVGFSAAVERWAADDAPIFVEINTHPILGPAIRGTLARLARPGLVLCAGRRGEPEHHSLRGLARELWLAGVGLRPAAVLGVAADEPARPRLLPLSAHTPAALRARAQDMAALLARDDAPGLDDVVYTAAVRRSSGAYRLAAPAGSRAAAAAALEAWLAGQTDSGVASRPGGARSRPKLVFVFPGQGSQWLGMGRQLHATEPAFRAALERCDAAVARHSDVSIVRELFAPPGESRESEIAVIQPLLFAVSVALAALWRSWGIEPDAVIGHSMGEIAAAHVAGALSLDDAACIICRRSRLLRRAIGRGAMAVVELSLADASAAIEPFADRVAIGGSNSPHTTILSGELDALEALAGVFAAREVFFRIVRATVPSHSPRVAFLGPDLLSELAEIRPRAGSVPICSTVTAELGDGADFDADYWLKNLCQPVRFAQGLETLAAAGHTVFLEVSAHPVLLAPMQQTLPPAALTLASLRRDQDERANLLVALGELYVRGLDPAWPRVVDDAAAVVALPLYPWQRERHWLAPPARARALDLGEHPLLGAMRSDSLRPGCRLWQSRVDRETTPWLADHGVQEALLVPAAAFLELGRAAATQALDAAAVELVDLTLRAAMTLSETGVYELQTVWTPLGDGGELHISSRELGPTGGGWTLHLTARARRAEVTPGPDLDASAPVGARTAGPELYAALHAAGFRYGPTFQGVAELWRTAATTRARVVPPPALAGEARHYGLHPAVLDAALQASLPLLGPGVWVPIAIARCQLAPGVRGELSVTATLRAPLQADAVVDLELRDAAGARVGVVEGLRLTPLAGPTRASAEAPPYLAVRWLATALPEPASTPPSSPPEPARWLVLAPAGPRAGALIAGLRAAPDTTVVWASPRRDDGPAEWVDTTRPDALEDLLARRFPGAQPCTGVVLAPGLDTPLTADEAPAALTGALTADLACALHLVQALAGAGARRPPRLFVVTRGATAAGGPVLPHQAPLQGLAAVLPYEHPELRTKRIDLGAEPGADELTALARELGHRDREDAVALRGDQRLVGRLGREVPADARARRSFPRRARPYRLAMAREGSLDGLVGRPLTRRAPLPHEVEIEVEAAGLNFFDVAVATGLVPGLREQVPALGVECAGRVSALGAEVQDLRVGDPVVAFAPASLASLVYARAEHVVRLPDGLTMHQAAGLPAAFVTACHALEHVGRLGAGERVLIHCATGGTGLAALQVAQALGAEVHATAGSEAKRARLRELGVRHVYDSRGLEFADQVLAATGDGVDVVLNSLAGPAVEAGLRALAPDGRFLELGKQDVYSGRPLGLDAFRRRLGYTAIDLLGLAAERPARFGRVLRDVMARVASGQYRPLPVESFPAAEADAALRKLARAAHMGKLVIDLAADAGGLTTLSAGPDDPALWAGGTWLISGGLGGLGLSLAEFLVARGVRHLVLVGRSAPTRPDQLAALARLAAAGATVETPRLDIADEAAVHALFDAVERRAPPIRGVVHAAMVLADGLLREQRIDRFHEVLGPKAIGAWNLHLATRHRDLDAFVLYSSIMTPLGSPGQGNYMAGNAFLDALAHHRRGLGLPALSVNWGAFTGAGAATEAHRGERLATRGLAGMTPEVGERWLGELLGSDATQIGVAALDARQWIEFHPQVAGSSWLSELTRTDATRRADTSDLRGELAACPPAGRLERLQTFVRQQLGQVLRLAPEQIDPDAPLKSLGVESLMGLELRNRLELGLALQLPATLIWTHPTVTALTASLLARLGLAQASAPEPAPPPPAPPPAAAPPPEVSSDLDALSDDELMARLAGRLGEGP